MSLSNQQCGVMLTGQEPTEEPYADSATSASLFTTRQGGILVRYHRRDIETLKGPVVLGSLG